jgi:acetaldehyde dehydrogenase (acetylating)
MTGKTFDNGLLCSSPNSVVVDEPIAEEARRQFQALGAHFLSDADADALARVLVTAQRLPNPALVGKPASLIAEQAGLRVPDGTNVLIVRLKGVGRDYPLSIEKLCPVLSWYVVSDWRHGCERCIEILRYGGMGHTMAIHSENQDVILQFGLKKPAFRICVNTPTTHGSIGLTTGLDPAMTLGCGGWGGNITSDNISPRHLLNIKRLAYEVRPAAPSATMAMASTNSFARLTARPAATMKVAASNPLPKSPAAPEQRGISAQALSARIDAFLAARGYTGGQSGATDSAKPAGVPLAAEPGSQSAAEFVCEDDVRAAMSAGRKLLIGEKTIITPSARDLGESAKVFVQASWPN